MMYVPTVHDRFAVRFMDSVFLKKITATQSHKQSTQA
jgi:hypothetical protein